jgi:hypothetical protein
MDEVGQLVSSAISVIGVSPALTANLACRFLLGQYCDCRSLRRASFLFVGVGLWSSSFSRAYLIDKTASAIAPCFLWVSHRLARLSGREAVCNENLIRVDGVRELAILAA